MFNQWRPEMKGHLSPTGHLDRLALVPRTPIARPVGEHEQAERAWQLDHELGFDPTSLAEYWLSNCHAFLVETPEGESAGVVDEVCSDPSTGQAASFEIAAGWFGRRRFVLPVETVRAILPLERRLVADPADGPDQRL